MYRTRLIPHLLHFKQPAGTSRGTYTLRKVWYVLITSDEKRDGWGIGECAPLPDLSIDAVSDYEYILGKACQRLEAEGRLDYEWLRSYPSILFGLETALRQLQTASFALWDTAFSRGEQGIPINGLIWMGDYRKMREQIEIKMAAGYRCIKLKIGTIDFAEELRLLQHIRQHYSASQIQIRVDANGAFSPAEALDKLKRLAEIDLHSIEQPIRAGQWQEMARLVCLSPLPIALDEELIGNFSREKKQELLETIRPGYIILKPSLHGGIAGCTEWIEEAERIGIGWWVTSALESNIGLNAIAQWTATRNNTLPQGLGTGLLFTDNIPMPLSIRHDCLWFGPGDTQTLSELREWIFPEERNAAFIRPAAHPFGQEGRSSGWEATPFGREVKAFVDEWFDDSPFITVQTSGSTGTPKKQTVRKDHMRQSAHITTSFFDLRKGDKALLCMPVQYIAGKMMVVRALVSGLDLLVRTPSSHPLAEVDEPLRFIALTPQQVYNSLQVKEETDKLRQTAFVIIGGGTLDKETEEVLASFPNAIYATYGMTETLSHIALRRINGPEASPFYTPFPSVKLSLSPENTLIIDAPWVNGQLLETNDIARLLPDGRFSILGRKDNVINSGGIKIQTEEVEEMLRSIISVNFAITYVPHPEFGEAVVLLLEKGHEAIPAMDILPVYQRPKFIFETERIPLTGSGKTDRAACKRLALQFV